MREPLLTIQDLIVTFPHKQRSRRILDRVILTLYPGEVMGLVGESGSGKSMTALSVMGLLPPAAKIRSGNVWFNGHDLLGLPERDLRRIRGSQIAMMFQNPRAALNPLMRAGNQVARVVRLHTDLSYSSILSCSGIIVKDEFLVFVTVIIFTTREICTLPSGDKFHKNQEPSFLGLTFDHLLFQSDKSYSQSTHQVDFPEPFVYGV